LLCCYPTRGLDFAATRAVHDELRRAASHDAAVVVVSIDLDELVAIADRLIVIQAGRITGEVTTTEALAVDIGLMLGGGVTG
jgi:simple sugar transport system ATP-binding protein